MQLTAERAHARREAFARHMPRRRDESLAPSLHRRQSFIDMERDMNEKNHGEKNQGEGNRDADRRYRQGVRETVHDTTEEERAKRARELTPKERDEAERAEREGRERKRSNSSEREI
jgi:hypothetical protein